MLEVNCKSVTTRSKTNKQDNAPEPVHTQPAPSSWPPNPETYPHPPEVASHYPEARDSSATRPSRRRRTSEREIWEVRSAAVSCHENFDPNVEVGFVGSVVATFSFVKPLESISKRGTPFVNVEVTSVEWKVKGLQAN